jgi:DNA-binding GntR family transcriptional regulator
MRQAQAPGTATESVAYGDLPDRIYENLKEQIIRGRLAPASRLVEADLALRFGVSRTPVREVLARLVRESYVVTDGSRRRTGFHVAPLTTQALVELWGIIGALEGLAVQAIATLSSAQRAELVRELHALNRELEMAGAARPRDVDRVGELMSAFHLCFMHRCAGPLLQHLYDGVRSHVQRYEWASAHSMAAHSPSVAEHEEIIAAIASGDGPRAKETVERHWNNGAERAVAVMERGNRGASRERKGYRAAPL